MKSTLLCAALSLLMFMVCLYPLQSQTQFREGEWAVLLEQAKSENKLILIDAITTWCVWCKEMDKENFSDSLVGKLVNTHYIPVRLDMETGMGLRMAMKYRVKAFPTFLVFTPDGQLVERLTGYRKKEQFQGELTALLDTAQHHPIPGNSSDWDLAYPDFYMRSFGKNGARVQPDTAVVSTWLDQQADLFSELSWAVLWRFPASQKYQQHFLDHIQTYTQRFGQHEVNDKLESILYSRLVSAIKTRKPEDLEQLLAAVDTYMPREAFDLKIQYRMFYAEKTENWPAFANALSELVAQKGVASNATYINNQCWTIYEQVRDSAIVHAASEWMRSVTEVEPGYVFLDTYAALLFKDKQYALAEKVALQAIEAGTKEKLVTRETEILLEKIRAMLQR